MLSLGFVLYDFESRPPLSISPPSHLPPVAGFGTIILRHNDRSTLRVRGRCTSTKFETNFENDFANTMFGNKLGKPN